ncbi:MAG TPA: hypothetical protein VJP79_00420 [Nitrososphaera sp.]|nr:hypothetical protein [Nitrososphaera sp.]
MATVQHYTSLCENVCNSTQNILAAWVFRDAELVSSFLKPSFPLPNSSEQKKFLVQAHLMVSMASTNQQMYGKLNYVSGSFQHADYYIFPMTDDNEVLLAVACVKPYSVDAIGKAVSVLTVR